MSFNSALSARFDDSEIAPASEAPRTQEKNETNWNLLPFIRKALITLMLTAGVSSAEAKEVEKAEEEEERQTNGQTHHEKPKGIISIAAGFNALEPQEVMYNAAFSLEHEVNKRLAFEYTLVRLEGATNATEQGRTSWSIGTGISGVVTLGKFKLALGPTLALRFTNRGSEEHVEGLEAESTPVHQSTINMETAIGAEVGATYEVKKWLHIGVTANPNVGMNTNKWEFPVFATAHFEIPEKH